MFFARICTTMSLALLLSGVSAAPQALEAREMSSVASRGMEEPLLEGLRLMDVLLPSDVHLEKRFDNARITWYNGGLGACGSWIASSDYAVALDPSVSPQFLWNAPSSFDISQQYGTGGNCGRSVRITANGHSVTATVKDKVNAIRFQL